MLLGGICKVRLQNSVQFGTPIKAEGTKYQVLVHTTGDVVQVDVAHLHEMKASDWETFQNGQIQLLNKRLIETLIPYVEKVRKESKNQQKEQHKEAHMQWLAVYDEFIEKSETMPMKDLCKWVKDSYMERSMASFESFSLDCTEEDKKKHREHNNKKYAFGRIRDLMGM
ncbi:hypothetical protein COD17_09155 [Bacillus thuringiensis]|nr:hypothetical protein COD17_09155 [Bacillus thuringiensis]